jgi:transposase
VRNSPPHCTKRPPSCLTARWRPGLIVRGLWLEIKIRTAQGEPLSKIAAELGIDRKTARKLRDSDVDPNVAIVRTRASRFAHHSKYVRERLTFGVPIAQIARDVARRSGETIPYTSFWEFASKLIAQRPEPVEEVRFETAPAQQAQCDWADFGDVIEDNVVQALSLFVMVLGYSRHTFACFTTSMDEGALQRAHQDAFEDFVGVPHSILYDNMRTVTSGRDGEGRPIWQRDFADFAGRYGYRPSCARPYRAKTKGKVERTIGFIRRSFLTGRTFANKADADAQLAVWLKEINQRRHGTHDELIHERLAHERPLLIPLRSGLPRRERVVVRVVDAEGAIIYSTNVYELPRGYRGRELTIRDDGRTLRTFAGGALIYEHELAAGRGERIRRRELVAPALERNAPTVPQRSLAVYDELVG